MVQREQWNGFKGRIWKEEVNTRDFIQNNYTPYEGDSSFLAGPTKAIFVLNEISVVDLFIQDPSL